MAWFFDVGRDCVDCSDCPWKFECSMSDFFPLPPGVTYEEEVQDNVS